MHRLFTPYLFPGLPQLVHRGSLAGWVLAMVYACFAMFVVAATIVWEEIIPPSAHGPLWGIFLVAWCLGIFISWQAEKHFQTKTAEKRADFQESDTLYLAQTAYLRREWFETERILHERLLAFPEDAPARLLLISMLRRTGREAEAEKQREMLGK